MTKQLDILITGGAGFIGSNLADQYLRQGHRVTIYDNLSRPGSERNLRQLETTEHAAELRYLIADVRETIRLAEAVKGKHLIVHQAGQTAVTSSLQDPLYDFEINAFGTVNLLEAARLSAPEAILLYSSTNKVYGDLRDIPLVEQETRYTSPDGLAIDESHPLALHCPYGCSKGAADQYVLDYARSFGLRTVVFRQSCIYGERQMGGEDQGWVAHFVRAALFNMPIAIYGNGKQVRDILYIADLARAYELACHAIDKTAGNAYNIGGGIDSTISLLETLDYLREHLATKINPVFKEARAGDQRYFVSDNAKALADFGWQPGIRPPEGLPRLIDWARQQC